MAVDVQVEFIAKATVRVHAKVYNDNDTLVDPTSITVTITDPLETAQVDEQAMTKDSTGVYDYYYNTTASTTKGNWTGEVIVIDGSGDSAKTSVSSFDFRIE